MTLLCQSWLLTFIQGYLIFWVGRPQDYGQTFTSLQHWSVSDFWRDQKSLDKKSYLGNYLTDCQQTLYQGSKFSDFLPTPRTILEISVNVKRFFLRGAGIGVQWPKMALECAICDPRSQEHSGGGPPGSLKRGCSILGSFNKHMHTPPSSALRAFRLFGRNPFWSLCMVITGHSYLYFLRSL